jgi:hypothetical protein
MRAALRRHPWAAHLPISGLPIMPREIAWFEDALACLAGTGLTEARKASVIMLLSGYVRNLAATEADIAAVVAASGLGVDEWMASYPRMLGQLADPRRFPALTAFIAAGVFETADSPDDEFIFGLGRILDGVGVLIGELRRRAEAGRPRFQRALAAVFHDPEGSGTASSTRSFAIIEIRSEKPLLP